VNILYPIAIDFSAERIFVVAHVLPNQGAGSSRDTRAPEEV